LHRDPLTLKEENHARTAAVIVGVFVLLAARAAAAEDANARRQRYLDEAKQAGTSSAVNTDTSGRFEMLAPAVASPAPMASLLRCMETALRAARFGAASDPDSALYLQ
jgi:hypothetical protein